MAIPANIRYIPPSERDGGLLNRLAALWEASVRATHHFLREADIENLKPYVTEGLAGNLFPIIEMRRKDFPIQTRDLTTKRT